MREDISGNLIVFGTDQVQNDTRTTVILGDQYVQAPVLLSNPRDTVNQVHSLIACHRDILRPTSGSANVPKRTCESQKHARRVMLGYLNSMLQRT